MSKKTVVILGSGTSLDGFDYGLLADKCVIAVNDAGLVQYPQAQTLISTDVQWWLSVAQGRRDLKNSLAGHIYCTEEKIFPLVCEKDGRICFLRRVRSGGLSQRAGIVHGMFTGAHAALDLACQTGARCIVLLGIDLRPNGQRKYVYGGDITPRTQRQFLNMRSVLEGCAQDLKRMNIKVINGSPDSILEVWPKMTPEAALKKC